MIDQGKRVEIMYPTEQGIVVIKGDQNATRPCLVVAINHEINQKE